MKTVRIVKNWDWPDLMRQSKDQAGRWGDLHVTTDPIEQCDYLVILNVTREPVRVRCPRDHVWQMLQEPPSPKLGSLYRGAPQARRVFFPADEGFGDPRMVATQTAIPWFVNQSYDELLAFEPPNKTHDLSWVTTKKAYLPGHRKRLALLANLQKAIDFDLFGRDFHFLEDKGDGLRPYRYSLAVENYSCQHYWTEKLADCLLSWTMPIYFGCTNLDEYFPPKSYIWIDINDPNAVDRVIEIIHSDQYEQNLDAIGEARQRILNEYQFFPLLASYIADWEAQDNADSEPEWIDIPAWRPPLKSRLAAKLAAIKKAFRPPQRKLS